MPRFTAKPIFVEAYQFLGNLAELPLNYASQLVQTEPGGAAYLPSTVMRTMRLDGDLEDVPLYSRGDVVNVDDWIILGVGGFYRMSPGEFDKSFAALPEEVDIENTGRYLVTYIGLADDYVPVLHWMGYRFPHMQAIRIDNAEHAERIRANSHFVVEDTLADDGNSGAVGSQSAAQAGAGDSAAGGVGRGFGNLRAGGPSDAGLAGDEYSDPGSLSSYPAAKRGPGRPGRTGFEGVRA